MMTIEAIAQRWQNRPGSITGALQDLQKQRGYLEEEAIRRLSEALNVPLSQVYGVATFFAAFRLKPRGQHHFQVCHGTACHVRGASQLMEKLKRDLQLNAGETSSDGRFSLEAVRCLGCCGLAPVVKLNEVVQGRLNQTRLSRLLRPGEANHESQ
jgi:NADH:ubiquinone oxidoreductase subunit E